jgi:hypothetical protein
LDEGRTDASPIRRFIENHSNSGVVIQIAAVAAGERQKDGIFLENFSQFRGRLSDLGLGDVEILRPPMYLGVSFFDWCLVHCDEFLVLERSIHNILFPNVSFQIDSSVALPSSKEWHRWLNAKCDVLTARCHIHYKGDVFVTADTNFHKPTKKQRLVMLGAKSIVRPNELYDLSCV